MYFLAIESFRDIAVKLLGEISPSMSFLYDIVAVVLCFLFFLVVFSFFIFFRNEIRKLR